MVEQQPYIVELQNQCSKTERKFLHNLFHDRESLNALSAEMFTHLRPSHFKDAKCSEAYSKIVEYYNAHGKVDYDRLVSKLKDDTYINEIFYSRLTDRIVDSENLDFFAQQVLDNARRFEFYHRVANFAVRFDENTTEEHWKEEIDAHERQWPEKQTRLTQFKEITEEISVEIKNPEIQQKDKIDYSIRYPKTAEVSPLCKKELLIIGGDTSMGKTAYALNLATSFTKNNYRGIYFLYEGSEKNLGYRYLSDKLEIDSYELRGTKRLAEKDRHTIPPIIEQMKETLLLCGECPTVDRLEDLVAFYKKRFDLDFIVVDHMHAMPTRGDLRQATIEITKGFLNIAKQQDILIISLAQFRKRENPEAAPTVEALRESSTIYQDAHHVWLLHDPSYYKKDDSLMPTKHINFQEPAQLIIAKNREGSRNITIPMSYVRKYHRWSEYEQKDLNELK